jgi:hypothetical protein
MNELKSALLLHIYKLNQIELRQIEEHFSKYDSTAIRKMLDSMYLDDNSINIKESPDKIHSVISITDDGKVQVTDIIIRANLTNKEIWKQRIYGFASGIFVSIISGVIVRLLAG